DSPDGVEAQGFGEIRQAELVRADLVGAPPIERGLEEGSHADAQGGNVLASVRLAQPRDRRRSTTRPCPPPSRVDAPPRGPRDGLRPDSKQRSRLPETQRGNPMPPRVARPRAPGLSMRRRTARDTPRGTRGRKR